MKQASEAKRRGEAAKEHDIQEEEQEVFPRADVWDIVQLSLKMWYNRARKWFREQNCRRGLEVFIYRKTFLEMNRNKKKYRFFAYFLHIEKLLKE